MYGIVRAAAEFVQYVHLSYVMTTTTNRQRRGHRPQLYGSRNELDTASLRRAEDPSERITCQ